MGGRNIIRQPGAKWAFYFWWLDWERCLTLSYASSGEEHVHDVGGFWFEIASTTAEVSSFMLTLLRCSAFPYWRAAAMVSLPSISADDSDFVEGRNMNINLFAQARSLGFPNVAAKFFCLKAYGREPRSMAFEALGVIVLVAHSTR